MPESLDTKDIDNIIGYTYKQENLRQLALTHPSVYKKADSNTDYERLEFLGDAVLELAITEYLYTHLPLAPEGLMTQLRSRVVSRPNLAATAKQLGLHQFLILGKGEERSGGRERDTTLSNTFEALLGAAFLDSDYPTTRELILRLLAPSLREVTENPREVNPKGELQALLQSILPITPVYQCIEIEENNHPLFQAQVFWQNTLLGTGTGESKRRAEVASATDALTQKIWEQCC